MDAGFDIRRAVDRYALAAMLPTIDNITFRTPADRFTALLAEFAEWLGNPDWLIYRYGAFLLGTSTRPYGPISLPTVIELADRLEGLSSFPGFSYLIDGFRNVTQFHDAFFESRVAALFVSLPAFQELEFMPEYVVRKSIKRPDLRVVVADRTIVVEAKVPRLNGSKAGRKFNRDVDCISSAMKEALWPSDRRLEVEVTSRLAEPMSQMSQRIVTRAARIDRGHFAECGVEVYVVPRSEPFATGDHGFISHVLFGENRVVGPFNAPDVNLRVVNDVLFGKVSTSVGSTLADALTQLPSEHECMIVIGDVPDRIAKEAITRRLFDPAYAHVKLFASWNNEPIGFFFRESEREFLRAVFPGAS